MKKKRQSPTQQIKDHDITWAEQAYVRFPGQNMVSVELELEESKAKIDQGKMSREYQENNKALYSFLHTHPYDPFENKGKRIPEHIPTPSKADYTTFLTDDNMKTMIIAQQNQETNEVEGYYFLRKTKKTPIYGTSPRESVADMYMKLNPNNTFLGELKSYAKILKMHYKLKKIKKEGDKDQEAYWEATEKDDPSITQASKDRIAKKYHLQQRFVPVQGYELNENQVSFSKKTKPRKQTNNNTNHNRTFNNYIFQSTNNRSNNWPGNKSINLERNTYPNNYNCNNCHVFQNKKTINTLISRKLLTNINSRPFHIKR